MLGYKDTSGALKKHVQEDDKLARRFDDPDFRAIAMHVGEEDKPNDKTALSLGQRGGWLINEPRFVTR